MTRTVLCTKYKEELEALDLPPMPGQIGQDLYQHVSKKAWQEWLSHQTMLINEKRLSLMNTEDRAYLDEQRQKFLRGEDTDQADGYVPPSS